MSNLAKDFNNLNGVTVNRQTLEFMLQRAEKERHALIQRRIIKVLEANPDTNKFKIEIQDLIKPFALNGEEDPLDFLTGLEYISESNENVGLGKAVSADDIYNLVTDLIINTINKVGHLPWQKEWVGSGSDMQAKNYVTKKPYSGINHIFLNFDVVPDPENPRYSLLVPIKFEELYYLTFNQIKEAKATLKKGSKGRDVFYYTMVFDYKKQGKEFKTSDVKKWNEFVKNNGISKEDIKLYLKKFPVLKYYVVFRADDCTGLKFPPKPIPKTTSPIEQAQEIIDGYPNPPKFTFIGGDAYYQPQNDVVNMPKISAFSKEEFYYSTYFHELVHSTGHSKRLDRGNDTRTRDGSDEDKKAYAFEELVAELGAVFMCSESGILFTTVDNSAKYLKGWNSRLITELENDNRFFMKASAMAQKAVNLILNRNQEEKIDEPIKAPIKTTEKAVPTIKKTIAKKVVAPKKEIQKNKFGKNQLVKVIYGECKNHIGRVLHCGYDVENGIFYYDVENACKDEISENNLADATVLKPVVKKAVAKKEINEKIIGYALLDSISGETVATKKTLSELKSVWEKLTENEIGKGTEIFVYEIISKAGKNVKGKRIDIIWIRETPTGPKKKATPKKGHSDTSVKKIDTKSIYTDEARFQNRNKLNQSVINQIIENYNPTKFDAIVVWIDDKERKTFVLAGHHRLEAIKRMKINTVSVKFFDGTEAEAIKYAKLESNANRSLELPQERAKLYREMRNNGATKKAVSEEAKKLEGKNANYILNLSYLQPNGITISALNQLSETGDKQNATLIEKIADWCGEARRNNEQLTNSHEKEIFDFLMDKEASKRINSKSEFLQKIVAATGMYFDYEMALNLKRFKNQTEGESVYDAEYNELKNKIDSIVANRLELIDRIKNPNNKDYIDPTKEKDYDAILTALDKSILKYNLELKTAQAKLIELTRNKGNYINAGSNQGALFGTKKPQLNGLIDGIITNVIANEFIGTEPKKNTISERLKNRPTEFEYFEVLDAEISDFLGDVERKNKDSIVISLTGGQGSGKTRFAFQFMNALAQKYHVGHASIEEHPESKLYYDKVEQYLNETAMQNIEAPEITTIQELDELIKNNDVIVIDSFAKMQEIQKDFEVDKDLRKKYNGKLFLVIFQQTKDGKMRGGSKSQFDADIVLFTEKKEDYRNNYVYADKNRYQDKPLDQLKFNIYSRKLVGTEKIENPDKPKQENNHVFSFQVN